MPAETLVANRFEIEREAGAGGMSRVFVARDRLDGARVALKVLERRSAGDLERFLREARVLSELRHPAIVRYVAHGASASGEPYLAMEWLPGRDLADRLAEGAISAAESLRVVARIAEALGVAHRQGLVHRDVKPSNVFLVDDAIDAATLIDFGIARPAGVSHGATRTGATVGTPGYMSPEQARGEPVDARADIYSLGCVLYECLTGRPAFQGEHAIAMLAKILIGTPPRPRDLVPELPEALDVLVTRMMAKDPSDRPADAAAVSREIAALGESSELPRAPPSVRRTALTDVEQRLVCIVLAVPSAAGLVAGDTVTPEQLGVAPAEARAAVARCGSELHLLADGSMIVTPSRGAGPAEQAWQAARSALALRDVVPGATISITTTRGTTSAELPASEVIDRAARALLAPRPGDGTEGGTARRGVRVDEATVGLLGERFDVVRRDDGVELLAERARDPRVPTLLGRPTLCVGRERELSLLVGLYEQAAEESVARAAVVVGPAGMGKSRVRQELLRRLAQRGAPEAWIAYGDPMTAGSPLGMLGQALRRVAGIAEGESLDERRRKVRARVARHVHGREVPRVTMFLGELVGAPFDDAESEALCAARRDPMLMNGHISRAFQDFLASESRAHPVVLVLEDLHWGDAPSVQLVDAALGHLHEGRLFVLALARPEVRGLFPSLWTERGVLELSLAELTRAASEKLVRGALGKSVDGVTLARVVERAGGNAFYLEELVRALSEGERDALPESVLAMAESRLQRLDAEARRALRAASVLGAVFWRGAVLALLGGEREAARVDQSLEILVHREVIARRTEPKLQGEVEYAFRHALLRDAAYAMLTDEDRTLGHKLAARWLVSAGERDALLLGEHFERGGDLARAGEWFRKAAENALEVHDLAGAVSAGDRALACAPGASDRGVVLRVQAEAKLWLGDNAEGLRAALAAADACGRHTGDWYAALGIAVQTSSHLSQTGTMRALGDLLREVREGARLTADQAAACGFAGQAFNRVGDYARCSEMLAFVERHAEPSVLAEPGVAIGLGIARASLAVSRGQIDEFKRHREEVAAVAERIGNLSVLFHSRASVAYASLLAGRYEEAERLFRDVLERSEGLGLRTLEAMARQNIGLALERLGRLDEARSLQTAALEDFRAQGALRMESASRYYLATISLRTGELDRAEREAREAVDVSPSMPPSHAEALGTLASVLLARGANDEALAVARRGMAILETIGSLDEGEPLLRLAHARALDATGEREEARDAVAAARRILIGRAEMIADPAWRESYLRIPENEATLELARTLGAGA